MSSEAKNKLILAILQEEDYADTISELNQNGFFVTLLNSTGGFLRKKSTTVMIGVPKEKLRQALDILRHYAGRRRQTVYQKAAIPHTSNFSALPMVPMEVDVGGVTVFVLDLEDIEKF